MLKARLIMLAVKVIMGAIALGVGIWYLSSSLGGSALTYTSMDNFLASVGVENGDIATANGCFMCQYIADLFSVIGDATARFWDLMVDNVWLLVALGFGVFILIHTMQYMYDNAKKTATLDAKEHKFEFKGWFDKVWKQGVRVLFVGALIGALGMGGTPALKMISQLTITPVLYVGSELSMAATGISDAAQCNALGAIGESKSTDILNPVMRPFMCVMGNLNSVMLAGAAGGFALMNYAWLGLGGGLFMGTEYYYQIIAHRATRTVKSNVFTFTTAHLPRTISLPATYRDTNCRDIGGYYTEDGNYRIKQGVAYRSAEVKHCTAEAKNKLLYKMGIKTNSYQAG